MNHCSTCIWIMCAYVVTHTPKHSLSLSHTHTHTYKRTSPGSCSKFLLRAVWSLRKYSPWGRYKITTDTVMYTQDDDLLSLVKQSKNSVVYCYCVPRVLGCNQGGPSLILFDVFSSSVCSVITFTVFSPSNPWGHTYYCRNAHLLAHVAPSVCQYNSKSTGSVHHQHLKRTLSYWPFLGDNATRGPAYGLPRALHSVKVSTTKKQQENQNHLNSMSSTKYSSPAPIPYKYVRQHFQKQEMVLNYVRILTDTVCETKLL